MNNTLLDIRMRRVPDWFGRSALLAVALLAFATRSYAEHADYYLEFKDLKGKEFKVPVASDGSYTTPALPAGTYTVQWGVGRGISSPTGGSADKSSSPKNGSGTGGAASITFKPQKIEMTYAIKSPYDIATGHASGKRMHKPITITAEIDKSTPLYRCAFDPIVIDADCDGLTGKIQWQAADGSKMAMDDWSAPN